jgi:hypothetical protein
MNHRRIVVRQKSTNAGVRARTISTYSEEVLMKVAESETATKDEAYLLGIREGLQRAIWAISKELAKTPWTPTKQNYTQVQE